MPVKKKRAARRSAKPLNVRKIFEDIFGFDIFSPQPQLFQGPVQVSPIPAEMFRKLLFLCHPDKHNNHSHSIEVTQWLLEERRRNNPGK